MSHAVAMKGQRFGRLVAIESKGNRRWTFICDCGNIITAQTSNVRGGNTRSCGCYRREQAKLTPHGTTHGKSKTPEYQTWRNMRRRCFDARCDQYLNYGGRGIIVCEQWADFLTFLSHVGQRPSCKHTLDRINNDGNYEPGNVRWATAIEQTRNRRRCIIPAARLQELLEKEKRLDDIVANQESKPTKGVVL